MRNTLISDHPDSERIDQIGVAVSSIDSVVKLSGLEELFMGELVNFPSVNGAVLNLEMLVAGVAILGADDAVKMGEVGTRSFDEVLLPVGIGVLGSVIDPIGRVYKQY